MFLINVYSGYLPLIVYLGMIQSSSRLLMPQLTIVLGYTRSEPRPPFMR